jgi:phage shock protein E
MRRLAALLITAAVALGLAGCAPASDPVVVSADTVIVDVRTPEEFASGHLEGAVNINLQSGQFEQEIGALPLDGEYLVYCRSGNRSAQAISIMQGLGFTDLTDLGGVDAAAQATGITIVTGG